MNGFAAAPERAKSTNGADGQKRKAPVTFVTGAF